jgi:NAD(P)-dependent dehydrogenase (short-subunit alcohol dehydrogenase family)
MAGKIALVTGAGSRAEGIGNGRATAILLARHGARVALLDQVADAAAATARTIEADGGTCLVIQADVSSEADCRAAVATVVERWQGLDILVNNVGVTGPPGSAVEVDAADWEAGMRINVTSMMLMAKYAVPEMIKRGGGAIVNMSSAAGLRGGYPSLLYPTTKGAIISLTRAMAAHHGRAGVRVNCVAPGTVYTPMVASRGMPEATRAARREGTLLGTEGTGWDIGYAVMFLVSDEARWITGITLSVDGGAQAGAVSLPVPPNDWRT